MKIMAFITFLILFASCYKETVSVTDLNLGGSALKYDVVVEGFISTENKNCEIIIYKPILASDVSAKTLITDATVVLKDGINTFPFDFVVDKRGDKYVSRDKIPGVVGRTYTLEIDYNGKVYTASDVMPETDDEFEIAIVDIEKESNDNITLLPGYMRLRFLEHNFGFDKFMIYQCWCIGGYGGSTGTLYNHIGTVPQGVFPSSDKMQPLIIGKRSDSVMLSKFAVSEMYHRYLITKFDETDWRSGLFSTVPGNVKTNVSEGGIGFFYATNVRRKLVTLGELTDGWSQSN